MFFHEKGLFLSGFNTPGLCPDWVVHFVWVSHIDYDLLNKYFFCRILLLFGAFFGVYFVQVIDVAYRMVFYFDYVVRGVVFYYFGDVAFSVF